MDENQTQTQAQEPGCYSAQTGADLRSKHSCVRTLLRGPLTALDSTCSSGFSVRMEFSAECGRLSPLGRERSHSGRAVGTPSGQIEKNGHRKEYARKGKLYQKRGVWMSRNKGKKKKKKKKKK